VSEPVFKHTQLFDNVLFFPRDKHSSLFSQDINFYGIDYKVLFFMLLTCIVELKLVEKKAWTGPGACTIKLFTVVIGSEP
jgi:hypothetical protein